MRSERTNRARARARERCTPICFIYHYCDCSCYLMKISQVPSGFDIDAILRLEVVKGVTIATATRHDSTRVRVASYRRPCASARRRTPTGGPRPSRCVDPRHRAIPRRERRRLFFTGSCHRRRATVMQYTHIYIDIYIHTHYTLIEPKGRALHVCVDPPGRVIIV